MVDTHPTNLHRMLPDATGIFWLGCQNRSHFDGGMHPVNSGANVMCLSITLQFNRVVPVLAVPGPGQDEAISDQGLADTLAGFRGHAT